MRKQTTTKQLQNAISNNLLHITKTEVYYKTSRKTETIDADKFKDSLDFLCESGVFADAVGWHFERDHKLNGYIAECGRKNPDTEIIVTVYLGVGEGVKRKDVDMALSVTEEE